MMQQLPGKNLVAIRRLRRSLVGVAKTQLFKDATAAKQIDMLNKTALAELEIEAPPEVRLAKERVLLEFQHVCISQFGNELKLMKAIIDRFDEIGYGCPIRWGILRLDLAEILEKRDRHDDAKKLRDLVRNEYQSIGGLVESLILARLT